MSAECSHLQNKMTELQYKLSLSNHYKNRLKSDIEGITAPAVIEQGYLKLIVREHFSLVSYIDTYLVT